MRVLSLDTSTFVGTVAVVVDDELVFEVAARVRASHGESILPWIDRALHAAALRLDQLDLVAYCRGPGSFTGVRIGIATAKGLALATGVPILGVSSLRALAHQLQPSAAVVCPVIDARKHEVYTAAFCFRSASEAVVLDECVCAPLEAGRRLRQAAGEREIIVVGEGFRAYEDEIRSEIGEPTRFAPRSFDAAPGAIVARLAAADFSEAGAREDVALAGPAYLRPPDAEYKPRSLL